MGIGWRPARPAQFQFQIVQMAKQPTGEVRAESEVSETEEAAEESQKVQSQEHQRHCISWEALDQWDPREINAEELNATILEHVIII